MRQILNGTGFSASEEKRKGEKILSREKRSLHVLRKKIFLSREKRSLHVLREELFRYKCNIIRDV